MFDAKLAKRAANTVRTLSADAIDKAKSGHPGMPLGCADMAVTLFAKHLHHNPANPQWIGRDRFVLSAGHGSMLEYSLLHLFGYGLKLDEIKQFRQWGSLTPGHPEYRHTTGVEITTGPLGSGFSSAVGMAMAEKRFEALTGLDKSGLRLPKMIVMCGDGCLMEGCTNESASLAGHLKLDNVVVFYDSNKITIEGSTDLAFSEDVGARFAALNWRVLRIDDANDIAKIDAGMTEALKSDGRPTIVICKTAIGWGAPNKQGKSSAHGEPLGQEETAAMKKALGMPEGLFEVEKEVYDFCGKAVTDAQADAAAWDKEFQKFVEADAQRAKLVDQLLNKRLPEDLEAQLLAAAPVDKAVASRASSGTILQKASELVPALWGGAADLAPSTKSNIKNGTDFSAENYAGQDVHFRIRELAMGLAGNGMAVQGSVIPYTSTFFVFSDYMKPAIRLAAIQKLHQIYIFTHDSFYVGEDGPTHEPIEQIAMLRSIPNMTVIRPAEAHEVAQAWAAALKADGPVALLLTRQNLEPYSPEMAAKADVSKGAFVLEDDKDFEIILIATGSEVQLALEAAKLFRKDGVAVRVVSMPSQEIFLRQDPEYQESVLPSDCEIRISLEAGSTFGWDRFTGTYGLPIGLDHFGASAPYKVLASEFGFTPEAVLARFKEVYMEDDCDCGCEDCHGDCQK